MNTENVQLIKELGRLGFLETEPVNDTKNGRFSICAATADDVTIENADGEKMRVITENVTDSDVKMLIAVEQFKAIKFIKNIVKWYVIISILSAIAWLLVSLANL